jgi:hypothetical protein
LFFARFGDLNSLKFTSIQKVVEFRQFLIDKLANRQNWFQAGQWAIAAFGAFGCASVDWLVPLS